MLEDIKWNFMVGWLRGDDETRDEKMVEVVAVAIAGEVVKTTQYSLKGKK